MHGMYAILSSTNYRKRKTRFHFDHNWYEMDVKK